MVETKDARVSWIEGFVPNTEEERIVHAIITEGDVRTLRALTGALAEELFERDRRRAGYLAGIGIFRAWYEPGAERLLNSMNGRAVLIDRRT